MIDCNCRYRSVQVHHIDTKLLVFNSRFRFSIITRYQATPSPVLYYVLVLIPANGQEAPSKQPTLSPDWRALHRVTKEAGLNRVYGVLVDGPNSGIILITTTTTIAITTSYGTSSACYWGRGHASGVGNVVAGVGDGVELLNGIKGREGGAPVH